MLSRYWFALVAVLALALPLSAAPILTNGSFETGTGSATTIGSFIRCNSTDCWVPGDTSSPGGIQGWTITGEIDYIGSLWVAQDGERSVDLSGFSPGGVSQTFATTPGWQYMVSFYLSGNPDGVPTIKTVNVSADSASTSFTFDTTGISHSNMGWVLRTWNFVATGPNTTLAFSTLDNDYGPVIDNVSVEVVPEPASMLLLGTGILGLAGLGRLLRKR